MILRFVNKIILNRMGRMRMQAEHPIVVEYGN